MNKHNYKKILSYILVLAWMILIFSFSADPAKVSDNKSGSVIQMFNFLGIDLNSILGEYSNFVVRKLGHFIEYTLLAILAFNALIKDFNKKTSFKLAILLVFLYACSDEFHQLFVPGRSGQIRDVLLDTLGGIFGAFIQINIHRKKL